MSNKTAMQYDELMAKCVEVASTVLGEKEAIIQIRRRIQPKLERNYTVYYEVYLATFEENRINPTNKRCVVVSIPIFSINSAKVEHSISVIQ